MTPRYGRIYGLYDPRNGTLRYIGQTVMPLERRLEGHVSQCTRKGRKQFHSACWIASLKKLGLRPVIRQLDEAHSRRGLDAKEKLHIRRARADGERLTNHTAGGKGMSGYHHSAKTKAKISSAKSGRPTGRRGIPHTTEARAKISASKRGKPVSLRKEVATQEILQQLNTGATFRQVGMTLGVSHGTVIARLNRARKLGTPVELPKKGFPKRIPVSFVLQRLKEGLTREQFAEQYSVSKNFVASKLWYARRLGMSVPLFKPGPKPKQVAHG